MFRKTIVGASIALLTACASGDQEQSTAQTADADPTRAVAGGTVPAGWQIRLDDKDAAQYTMNDVKFVNAGDGFQVTSGPAAIYPGADLPNEFMMEATFAEAQAPAHPEAYGLFFSGKELENSDKQEYVYFIVRNTGEFMINHRAGRDVHKIFDWRAHAAVRKGAPNQLTIRSGADSVRFMANGQQVAAITRREITNPSGKAGLRVNHNLDVRVTGFKAEPATQ